jgi:hypothetical protein
MCELLKDCKGVIIFFYDVACGAMIKQHDARLRFVLNKLKTRECLSTL